MEAKMKKYIKTAAVIGTVAAIILTLFSNASALTTAKMTYTYEFKPAICNSGVAPINNLAGTYGAADFAANDYASLVSIVAEQYVARDSNFTVRYSVSSLSQINSLISSGSALWTDIFSVDLPDTTSDLDYLYGNVSNMYVSGYWYGTYAVLEFEQTYLTTAAQEAYVDAAVPVILSGLKLGEKSTYGKIKAIHDYIIRNVEYDYSLNNYSAYDGLYSKKTVCNGYALMMYKMLIDAGVPVRKINGTGISGGESDAHAWNIAKIGQYWYNIDATWDDSYDQTRYFLKNSAAFSDHIRNTMYNTDAFNAAYPMSPVNFDPSRDTTDVTPSAWAKEDIDALSARGVIPEMLMSGYTQGITRAEFTALTVNVYEYAKGAYTLKNAAPFTDIAGNPYAGQIAKGYELGIIEGVASDSFAPNATLTREQCAKIISAAVKAISGIEISANTALPFSDNASISGWALPFVCYAYKNGLMNGTGINFDPKGVLTREQAMAIAERMIEKYNW